MNEKRYRLKKDLPWMKAGAIVSYDPIYKSLVRHKEEGGREILMATCYEGTLAYFSEEGEEGFFPTDDWFEPLSSLSQETECEHRAREYRQTTITRCISCGHEQEENMKHAPILSEELEEITEEDFLKSCYLAEDEGVTWEYSLSEEGKEKLIKTLNTLIKERKKKGELV